MTNAESKLGEIQSHLIGGLPAEPLETDVHGTPVLCLPPGWSHHEQAHLLTDPVRINRHQVFSDLVSWMDYVNRFKNAWSVIFLEPGSDQLRATAELDYHGPGGVARWCSHTAEFKTLATPAWTTWSGSNDKVMKQSEFSDFLYQNEKEIVNPAGAELLEIIQTLKATSAGEFREMRDDFSGSSELIYRMKISSQGGTSEKPLSLPNQFKVVVEPFYGCPFMALKADLRVRAPTKDGDPLLLGFRFYRLTDQLQMLTDAISKLIAESTSLPVWR